MKKGWWIVEFLRQILYCGGLGVRGLSSGRRARHYLSMGAGERRDE